MYQQPSGFGGIAIKSMFEERVLNSILYDLHDLFDLYDLYDLYDVYGLHDLYDLYDLNMFVTVIFLMVSGIMK